MEIFRSQDPTETKLYIEVKFDFEYVARTYVIKEEEGTWKKKIVLDSLPGTGIIKFTPIDKTSVFKDKNRVVVKTYLDLQKIDKVDAYLKAFKIQYNLLEDDDLATPFNNSAIYYSKDDEFITNDDKTNAMFTKVIKIV